MAKVSDPTYVSGRAPNLKIQPPIEHPAFCVCPRCSKLPAEERTRPHLFRIYRASKFPASERDSIIHAADVKRDEERKLREAAEVAVDVSRRSSIKSLSEICELYFAMNPKKVSEATIERDRINARNLCRLIPSIPPAEIDEPAVVRYRNAREKEGAAPRTIWNEMTFLKMVLGFGLRWNRETGMQGMRLTKVPEVADTDPPGVALTTAEIKRILAAADSRSRLMVVVALTTMLRRTPLLALHESWLDLDGAWLSVPASIMKKGKSKRRYSLEVPLSHWAVDELRAAKTIDGHYITSRQTGKPITQVFRILDPLAKKAKVREFSLHDLRTTGATLLREAGVDELIVAILLGHHSTFDSDSQTFHPRGANVTRGYTKLFEPSLRTAVAVFDDLRRKVT